MRWITCYHRTVHTLYASKPSLHRAFQTLPERASLMRHARFVRFWLALLTALVATTSQQRVSGKILPYYKKTLCSQSCETLVSGKCRECGANNVATVMYGTQSSSSNCTAGTNIRCDARYFTNNLLEIFFLRK